MHACSMKIGFNLPIITVARSDNVSVEPNTNLQEEH